MNYQIGMNLKNFFLFIIFTVAVLKSSISFASRVEIKSENICLDCRVLVQQLLSYAPNQSIQHEPQSKQSLITMTHGLETLNEMENSALNHVISRTKHSSDLAKQLNWAANNSGTVHYKLYYQLSLSPYGQTSLFTENSIPSFEVEKNIPHELWGFYQILDNKAYILLNEYQHGWNADYTLVHEWFHLFDKVTENYISEIRKKITHGLIWIESY